MRRQKSKHNEEAVGGTNEKNNLILSIYWFTLYTWLDDYLCNVVLSNLLERQL